LLEDDVREPVRIIYIPYQLGVKAGSTGGFWRSDNYSIWFSGDASGPVA
jgi:hypothetical protein